MNYNIVTAGVGGQGVLFLSWVLGEAALGEGFYPCIGEVHGMAQRGGTVIATVRISDRDGLGPLIKKGDAHALIALEPLEAARFADMLSRDGLAVVNTYPVRIKDYPDIQTLLSVVERRCETRSYDAFEVAKKVGGEGSANMVLLGTLAGSKRMPIEEASMKAALRKRGNAEQNIRCFEEGLRI